MRLVIDNSGTVELQHSTEKFIIHTLLKQFVAVVIKSPINPKTCGIILPPSMRMQAQFIFEFMELLVKPMVNTFVPDPRLTVTEEIIKFVKESNLPKLAL